MRSMKLRLLKPLASARLAQSSSRSPETPSIVVGTPIPIFTTERSLVPSCDASIPAAEAPVKDFAALGPVIGGGLPGRRASIDDGHQQVDELSVLRIGERGGFSDREHALRVPCLRPQRRQP